LQRGCTRCVGAVLMAQDAVDGAVSPRLTCDPARAARVVREIAGTTPATPPSHDARERQAVLSRHARAIRTTLLIQDTAGRTLQDIHTDTDADLVPSGVG
jgi:hypothetical protein